MSIFQIWRAPVIELHKLLYGVYIFQAKDKTQMTPLHVASSQGSFSVAKCLIDAGANLRSLDEEQMTPMHFACMEGSLEVAKLLFETGV